MSRAFFLDLVQADRPDVIAYLHKAGRRFTSKVTAKNRRDITMRAHKAREVGDFRIEGT